MSSPDYLTFKFAPHILEDLGVNLYTALPKALVEFVANAHDADASLVVMTLDPDVIHHAKEQLRATYMLKKKQAASTSSDAPLPLSETALPDEVAIIIEDDGHGMSRADLESKFLVIGRRRRKGAEKQARTDKGRIIMGRKGLGKLAGFGIAHLIDVTSKVPSSADSTKITLDLESLLGEGNNKVQEGDTAEGPNDAKMNPPEYRPVQIPVEIIKNDSSFPKGQGTRITLRRLVYEGLKGDMIAALAESLAENFYGIKQEDFQMKINTEVVDTQNSDFVFAWPNPDKSVTQLVEGELPSFEEGQAGAKFQYRIRFRGPRKQLAAKQRGVRVYAHHRLASVPDLLDVKSSAHGFQYTSYLDGVVVADWIDEQRTDYISTDRQNLRWETPILATLRVQLTSEITKALNEYAEQISEGLSSKLKEDEYTKDIIERGRLPEHRQRVAWAIAKTLAGKDAGDLEGEFYKTTLKSIVNGLGHGQILSTIYEIASKDKPELQSVITEITKLTYQEFDDFLSIVEGRLKAIQSLRRICEAVDFKQPKNEKALHELFKKNTWLIDPTFFEFLASDEDEKTVAKRLTKELEIAEHAPASKALDTDERPDLCFLIGSSSLKRFVIIEFKAPNVPLRHKHLSQLLGYMERASEWLKNTYVNQGQFQVEGILIGSKDFEGKTSDDFVALKRQISKWTPGTEWKVWDILEVLESAEKVHKELLGVSKSASRNAFKEPLERPEQ